MLCDVAEGEDRGIRVVGAAYCADDGPVARAGRNDGLEVCRVDSAYRDGWVWDGRDHASRKLRTEHGVWYLLRWGFEDGAYADVVGGMADGI